MNATRQNIRRINVELAKIGGEYHPHIPLIDMMTICQDNGFMPIQEDGTRWSGILCGREGRVVMALSELDRHEADKHKYVRGLCVTWYKMESGSYEVVAYVS